MRVLITVLTAFVLAGCEPPEITSEPDPPGDTTAETGEPVVDDDPAIEPDEVRTDATIGEVTETFGKSRPQG